MRVNICPKRCLYGSVFPLYLKVVKPAQYKALGPLQNVLYCELLQLKEVVLKCSQVPDQSSVSRFSIPLHEIRSWPVSAVSHTGFQKNKANSIVAMCSFPCWCLQERVNIEWGQNWFMCFRFWGLLEGYLELVSCLDVCFIGKIRGKMVFMDAALGLENWEILVLESVIDTCSCVRHGSRNSVLMNIPTLHFFALDSYFYKWRYIL